MDEATASIDMATVRALSQLSKWMTWRNAHENYKFFSPVWVLTAQSYFEGHFIHPLNQQLIAHGELQ